MGRGDVDIKDYGREDIKREEENVVMNLSKDIIIEIEENMN
jgi:hypothetical protein